LIFSFFEDIEEHDIIYTIIVNRDWPERKNLMFGFNNYHNYFYKIKHNTVYILCLHCFSYVKFQLLSNINLRSVVFSLIDYYCLLFFI